MNCVSIFTFIALAFVAFASAAKEFKFSKHRIPAKKYESRCEDDDSNLASLNLDNDNLDRVVKFMRHARVHEAWIGSVNGSNFDGGAILLKIFFDSKGKFDFHTFEVIPSGHAMKFASEYYAVCARK